MRYRKQVEQVIGAASRAGIPAVVVASPRLMDIQCHSVHQLKLVNSLCWVGEG